MMTDKTDNWDARNTDEKARMRKEIQKLVGVEIDTDRLRRLLAIATHAQAAEPGPEKKFTHAEWDKLLKETIDAIYLLSTMKGGEYAAEGDRLDNFRRNGADCGVPMEVCWRIYAGKHWDSISTYVRDMQSGKDRVRSESILGRADDLIVYLILFKAMCKERGIE